MNPSRGIAKEIDILTMEEVEVYLEFRSKHILNFVPREYHTFFPFDIQHYV